MPPCARSVIPPVHGLCWACVFAWVGCTAQSLLGAHVTQRNRNCVGADRLFGSLAEAWHSVTSLPMDVKELTPEFYCDPAFLVNGRRLDFGTRSSGAPLRETSCELIVKSTVLSCGEPMASTVAPARQACTYAKPWWLFLPLSPAPRPGRRAWASAWRS